MATPPEQLQDLPVDATPDDISVCLKTLAWLIATLGGRIEVSAPMIDGFSDQMTVQSPEWGGDQTYVLEVGLDKTRNL